MARAISPTHPVILFDGDCSLCNASVRWIIAHDRSACFRFAARASAAAQRALAEANVALGSLPDSMVLIERGDAQIRVAVRSDAALRIACKLGFPWWLVGVALAIPRPVRDTVYDWVARHRHRWFGHDDTCLCPTPELRARFLDADERLAAESQAGPSSGPAP